MLPKTPYPSDLADLAIPEIAARDGEPLPVGAALALMFAMSLSLWSIIAVTAMTARALF
jgi:hypothetical protein